MKEIKGNENENENNNLINEFRKIPVLKLKNKNDETEMEKNTDSKK